MNKPKEIQLTAGRWVKMYYDGGGSLLKRSFSTGEYWEYAGEALYKNGQFVQFGDDEGRILADGSGYAYEFSYKDHLGNTRVSFRADGNQLVKTAETAFDPWGVELAGVGQNSLYENRFRYQEKESLALFGLSNIVDSEARYLDRGTGRFWGIDALADKNNGVSGYAYVMNNPLSFVDPFGLDTARTDFQYSNGYQTLSGRNSSTSNQYYGVYQNTVTQRKVSTRIQPSIAQNRASWDKSKYTLDIGGGIYGALETASAPSNQWLGKNGKYYDKLWGGNQYTGSRLGALRAASRYKVAGSVTMLATAIIGGVETYNGYQVDGGRFGYNAQIAAAQTVGGIGGGIGGATLGAQIGGALGAFFFGAGAVSGAILGGFVGGWIGGEVGSSTGKGAVNFYHNK
ncbi:hypothetical protein LAG90_05235 [Marinilongibacter aquaticus]|uniref:RHS repeat-associated core domain-containing protein n=1 Tax=Marinilongibacter aquaticus TaxID=2975157 RepID=UPI0021BD38E9|nr:RHS repeat-associated core domain-containing protein [Marinilongibacter aquaticus]UBM60048.1 hypothetical protein LAG90_05235 [Marinilongibacter aquaticus]